MTIDRFEEQGSPAARSLTRRAAVGGLSGGLALAAGLGHRGGAERSPAGAAPGDTRPVVIVDRAVPPRQRSAGDAAIPVGPVRPTEFDLVGVYDVDWLADPSYERLLDNLAASPGGFGAVRCFGGLSSGTLERTVASPHPWSGTVWPSPDAPIDFSATFRALDAVTSRGLTPFLALTFFPAAVSPSAIAPPPSWERWQELVRAFFARLAADRRFGPVAIRDWWFEVWNEPNIAGFWAGGMDDYFALYRVTSAAVRETGLEVRLGGPAIAYLPEGDPNAGRRWMEEFLRFLSAEPEVKCDFLSLHRKGAFGSGEPDVRLLVRAAEETVAAAEAIDAARFAGLSIIDDEADEKVGFDTPYEPRLTEQVAAWNAAVLIAHDALSGVNGTRRFYAAADNANLHLVREPFDGRRSIVTRASAAPRDLIKLPVYAFYELLRLLGDEHGQIAAGGDYLHPTTDLYHLISTAPTHVASLWTNYPTPGGEPPATSQIDYTLTDLPWPRVNVAHFRIDRTHSNAYTAAGRSMPRPDLTAEEARAARLAQELATLEPIRRDLALTDGTFRTSLTIEPYATSLLWLTPFDDRPLDPPSWLETTVEDSNVVLRWTPNREPFFYGYEVVLIGDDGSEERTSPEPLRAAMWVVTAPPPGRRRYGVRAVSASGVASAVALSDPVEV